MNCFILTKKYCKENTYKISKCEISPARANRAPKISKNIVSYVYKLSAPTLNMAKTYLRKKNEK